jgi:hypothetical protein
MSGGRESLQEQTKLGGQIDKCIFASYGFITLPDNRMEDLINAEKINI